MHETGTRRVTDPAMHVIKTLWASVSGDPVFMRRTNGWLTLFWIAMIPVSVITGWINSVAYISALSLWALVGGHWAAWQAARVEVEQQLNRRVQLIPIRDVARHCRQLVSNERSRNQRQHHQQECDRPKVNAAPEELG